MMAVLLLSPPCSADETGDPYLDAIITDRPDITESSQTVGKLRLQIETAFEFVQDEDGGITTRDYYFPTLVRFGIIEPLEFRIQSPIYFFETNTGRHYQSGPSDVQLGLKGHVLDQGAGGIPSLGLLASVWLPVGDDHFSFNTYVPAFLVLADWELPWNLEFGVNLGVNVPPRDSAGDKYAQFLYSAAVSYKVHGTNNRFRVFVEVSGLSPFASNKADWRSINSGITFLITPNIQVDGFVRVGITPSTPDMFGGVGWSFRFF